MNVNNYSEPGKRTLILGANGFGNLAGIIGSEIYSARYGPSYRTSFFITLGISIVALIGYACYRLGLAAVNRYKKKRMAMMSADEQENERSNSTRYADRKYTFLYSL